MAFNVMIINGRDNHYEYVVESALDAIDRYIEEQVGFGLRFSTSKYFWNKVKAAIPENSADTPDMIINDTVLLANGFCKSDRYRIKKVFTEYLTKYPVLTGTAGLTYAKSADGTYAEVTGYTGTDSTVEIGTEYIGFPVRAIGAGAFSNNTAITSVTLPEGITTVEDNAFQGCSNLSYITMPNSIESIGEFAFNNTALTSIDIPSSLRSIGNDAFAECNITDVYITDPSAWCKIDFGNVNADPMLVANSLHLVDEYKQEVYQLTLDDAVSEIPTNRFKNCTYIQSAVLPDSINTIGAYAFNNCDNLGTVNIPNSVTTLGLGAFYSCSSLTSVTIGNSVETIGNKAFYECSSLTSATIGNSVKTVGDGTFYKCVSLTGITIPTSVTTIADNAFYGSGLTSVDIPGSVISIGDYAFSACTGLSSVSFGEGLDSIGKYAFYGCNSLYSVTLPTTVKYIYDSAFLECNKLGNVTYSGTDEQWKLITIEAGNSKLTDVHYNCGFTCKDFNTPVSITYKNGHTLSGTISSNNPIAKIKAYFDGYEEDTRSTEKCRIVSYTDSNTKTIVINSGHDFNSLQFGTLDKGEQTLIIKAQDIYQKELSKIYQQSFTVE